MILIWIALALLTIGGFFIVARMSIEFNETESKRNDLLATMYAIDLAQDEKRVKQFADLRKEMIALKENVNKKIALLKYVPIFKYGDKVQYIIRGITHEEIEGVKGKVIDVQIDYSTPYGYVNEIVTIDTGEGSLRFRGDDLRIVKE